MSREARHSLHGGFTVSFVLSPEIGLVVSVADAMRKHCRQLDASVEAPGPHDFAVRLACVRRSQAESVHRSPRPTFVTIAIRPSFDGHGMRRILLVICPTPQPRGLRLIGTTGKSGGAKEIMSSDEQLPGTAVIASVSEAIQLCASFRDAPTAQTRNPSSNTNAWSDGFPVRCFTSPRNDEHSCLTPLPPAS